MKKKMPLIILVIFLLVAGVVGYFGYNYYIDEKEKTLLEDEMTEIVKYINNDDVDTEKIKEITAEDITTGNRLAVEKALENYIIDMANAIKTSIILLDDQRMTNLLTAANYQSDGPNFVSSKNYISETKQKLLQNKESILMLTDTTKVVEYFTNPTDDDYYDEMYKELAIGNGLDMNSIRGFSDSIDSIINLLDVSDETLTFLSQNVGAWQIQNNQIYFTNENLLNTYNSYIAKIK